MLLEPAIQIIKYVFLLTEKVRLKIMNADQKKHGVGEYKVIFLY